MHNSYQPTMYLWHAIPTNIPAAEVNKCGNKPTNVSPQLLKVTSVKPTKGEVTPPSTGLKTVWLSPHGLTGNKKLPKTF